MQLLQARSQPIAKAVGAVGPLRRAAGEALLRPALPFGMSLPHSPSAAPSAVPFGRSHRLWLRRVQPGFSGHRTLSASAHWSEHSEGPLNVVPLSVSVVRVATLCISHCRFERAGSSRGLRLNEATLEYFAEASDPELRCATA